MTIFQSIVLGIIQGLGEFLPISSSGHLVVVPWIFEWNDPGLSFDVALHFGTLIAVLGYFWEDLINIIKNSFLYVFKNKREKLQTNGYGLLICLIIATIPGAIFGFLLEKKAETVFRNPLLVALALFLAGLVLYVFDRYSKKKKTLENINFKDALAIGLSQALAIIPGVSRSGATISAALSRDFDRQSAARFSFLLSAPIIFGASILKLDDFIHAGIGIYEITGIISAALSGYFAIAVLIRFIEKASYKIFFWYRILLSAVILAVYIIR